MKVADLRQTILANNLANASTTGFKHDLAVVTQRPVESRESPGGGRWAHPVLDGLSGGVNVRPSYYTREQGDIEWTGRPLDLAIRGEGFFAVSDSKETRYTRNGEFAVNAAGEVVLATESGRWRLLDDTGNPVTVDPKGPAIKVSPDGAIRQGNTAVATLGLTAHDDPAAMQKIGENLFQATRGPMRPATGTLVPESRELSTYDPVQGLASMIEASRSYQMNATLLQMQDDLIGQAVTTLGRVA
jgi:flagellar basal body rod protein FlgG